ncbi:LacI family DNA-binding transcriptional regulator [Sphingobacterium lactis]|uniref:LacI family transcriptional regulator n=1 Tax=Sphingobacterium lactis TaxID=797291 RepID=A0A1H5U5R7_9SPHI|nr:LacI family DNA-binding transcriptional regulator [Sphingobacterium lactis]SEF70383.1 LacI family transcriptional regulator [Sphingobacterium lactis]
MKIVELSGVKEIARRANVSIATVDRVLHNRTGVAQKTKEKILSIIKDMDYKPNILAKRLASKRIYKFGILIPQECSEAEYWNGPVSGIKEALSEFGDFGVEISYHFFDKKDRDSFKSQTETMLKMQLDGVIVVPVFIDETRDFAMRCSERRVQFVFIESEIPQISPLSYIGQDYYQAGRVVGNLCQYLLRPGDDVLVLNISKAPDIQESLQEKLMGFEAFLSESDVHCKVDSLDVDAKGMDEISSFLDHYLSENSVKLIYVTNSRAYMVAKYLEDRGFKHIRLVGNGYHDKNLNYLKNGYIDFLICQKPLEQGYKAFLALYEHFIAKRKVERTQYTPIDIVTKENYKYYEN